MDFIQLADLASVSAIPIAVVLPAPRGSPRDGSTLKWSTLLTPCYIPHHSNYYTVCISRWALSPKQHDILSPPKALHNNAEQIPNCCRKHKRLGEQGWEHHHSLDRCKSGFQNVSVHSQSLFSAPTLITSPPLHPAPIFSPHTPSAAAARSQ